jgi:hypothetical protein
MRITGRIVIALLVTWGLLLTACGDDDSETTSTSSTSSTTSSSTSSSSTSSSSTTSSSTTTSTSTISSEGPSSFFVFLLPADVGDDCGEVIAAERQARVEGAVGDALAQQLAGPTSEETAAGLNSWFSAETEGMLTSVTIEDGLAEVDFEDFSGIIPNASTSCGSAALLAQLDETVLQFPEVDRVVYSFDGDRDAFYEWLQRSAP